MHKIFDLLFKMLRFRTALLLLLFVALGDAATKSDIALYSYKLLYVVGALGFWYIFSTSTNDLADEEIDKVNLRGYKERPLANQEISRKSLWITAVVTAFLALGLSAAINKHAIVATAITLALSYCYSFPPLRLSARGIIAPLTLPIGYVVYPFVLTSFANNSHFSSSFLLLIIAIYISFSGRIILKDFRDIEGDRRFGKKTFLVRHGATRTCLVSGIAWVCALGVIAYRFADLPLLVACILPVVACILLSLSRLAYINKIPDQLLYIGLIGRLANGCALLILVALYFELAPLKTLIYSTLIVLLTVFIFLSSWALYEKAMRDILRSIHRTN